MELLTIIKIQITTLPARGDKYYHCIALSQFAYMRKNITPHRFVHAIENCDEDFIGYIINNIKKTRLKTYLPYRNYKAFKSAVENGSLKVVKLLLDEAEEAEMVEDARKSRRYGNI